MSAFAHPFFIWLFSNGLLFLVLNIPEYCRWWHFAIFGEHTI